MKFFVPKYHVCSIQSEIKNNTCMEALLNIFYVNKVTHHNVYFFQYDWSYTIPQTQLIPNIPFNTFEIFQSYSYNYVHRPISNAWLIAGD